MLLYDNESPIDWFYDGVKSKLEMQENPRFSGLFDAPSVLFDNGAGKVYSWRHLQDVCEANFIRYTSPEASYAELQKVFGSSRYLSEDVEDLQQEVTEVKQIAESAGADPQLQALAALQVSTMDLTKTAATTLAGFRDYWPEWEVGKEYKQNDPLRHGGLYYRVSQDHTSQETYPPDTAGESMYYPVTIAPDGVIIYRECHGQYDMVRKGEKRHYPGASDPVYVALEDTAYSPDAYPQHWQLAEEA